MDLPGLLGEDTKASEGRPAPSGGLSAPGSPEDAAWEQAAALLRQLDLARQPAPGPEQLRCVYLLLLHRGGLQLSQLLRVQAACAALTQRKVCPP